MAEVLSPADESEAKRLYAARVAAGIDIDDAAATMQNRATNKNLMHEQEWFGPEQPPFGPNALTDSAMRARADREYHTQEGEATSKLIGALSEEGKLAVDAATHFQAHQEEYFTTAISDMEATGRPYKGPDN